MVLTYGYGVQLPGDSIANLTEFDNECNEKSAAISQRR